MTKAKPESKKFRIGMNSLASLEKSNVKILEILTIYSSTKWTV